MRRQTDALKLIEKWKIIIGSLPKKIVIPPIIIVHGLYLIPNEGSDRLKIRNQAGPTFDEGNTAWSKNIFPKKTHSYHILRFLWWDYYEEFHFIILIINKFLVIIMTDERWLLGK